jgi:hypothetical protein
MLMCAPRSIFGWDIIVIREGDKVILDKRDGGSSGEYLIIWSVHATVAHVCS